MNLNSTQRQSWVDCIPIETPQITRVHWTGPDSCCSAAVFSWRLPLCSGERRRRRRKGAGSWCGCCHEAGVRTQQLTSSARRRLGTSGRIIWTICTILYGPAAIFIFWVVFGRFLLLSQIFPSDFEDWYISFPCKFSVRRDASASEDNLHYSTQRTLNHRHQGGLSDIFCLVPIVILNI